MASNYLQIGADAPPAPPKQDEVFGVPTYLLLFAGLAAWVWTIRDDVRRIDER